MRYCLRLAALVALAATAGRAVDWKALHPQGYVSDFAGVVDASSKSQLEDYCHNLQQSTGVQLALVTIQSLEGEPVEDVANTIARAWGVGQKGQNNGILLLLAIQDHRSRLEIGYGLEPILPDGLDGSILREMRPALRQQQYGEAMMAAAETLGSALTKAKNTAAPTPLPRQMRPTVSNSIPWPLVLGGLVTFWVVLFWIVRKAIRRTHGMISRTLYMSPGPSDLGTHSGGGFGSFDSSDSFGGFGGGDFGGGGASSDW